ncbi:transcription initiation factor TFIID, subunit TAF5, partial [Aureobasidium melanogenum]
MSGPPPQPQRTASVGPQNVPPTPGHPPQQPAQPQSQQNLNQIVLEYLAKKGYNRTEAMLRRESAHADAEGRPIIRRAEDAGGEMYEKAYELLLRWVEKSLDIYKDELGRLLWPIFVHSFLALAANYYPRQCANFFKTYREQFEKEHQDDIRALQAISLPEHVQNNHIAKLYRENHYRLTITDLAYSALLQFLEAHDTEGGSVILNLITNHIE